MHLLRCNYIRRVVRVRFNSELFLSLESSLPLIKLHRFSVCFLPLFCWVDVSSELIKPEEKQQRKRSTWTYWNPITVGKKGVTLGSWLFPEASEVLHLACSPPAVTFYTGCRPKSLLLSSTHQRPIFVSKWKKSVILISDGNLVILSYCWCCNLTDKHWRVEHLFSC